MAPRHLIKLNANGRQFCICHFDFDTDDGRAPCHLANPLPSAPLFACSTYQKIDTKWHYDDGDQQIGYSQRHYKIIRNRLQRTLSADGQDDENVAEESQDGKEYQYQRPIVVVHCKREEASKRGSENAIEHFIM